MPESSPIQTLDGVTTGKYVVTTFSGTRHFIDLEAQTLIRQGAAGREWSAGGIGFGPVTPDGEAFRFASIQNATVGKSMRLDNSEEWRITSEIQAIEEWVEVSESTAFMTLDVERLRRALRQVFIDDSDWAEALIDCQFLTEKEVRWISSGD